MRLVDDHHHEFGDLDLGPIPSESLAVLGKSAELARYLAGETCQIRPVGVLGDHPQGLLLAGTADHHGDLGDRRRRIDRFGHVVVLAVQRRSLTVQHRQDDVECFFESRPLREGVERDVEGVVLEPESSGSDPSETRGRSRLPLRHAPAAPGWRRSRSERSPAPLTRVSATQVVAPSTSLRQRVDRHGQFDESKAGKHDRDADHPN